MDVMARRAWRWLAVVPVMAVLAAPGSAVAGPGRGVAAWAERAAAPASAPGLAGHGPVAYVTVAGYSKPGDTVRPIATATNTPGKPVKVGDVPAAIAITPDGRTAYVVNELGSLTGPSTVTPIATATNKPGKPIKVGDDATAIAIRCTWTGEPRTANCGW